MGEKEEGKKYTFKAENMSWGSGYGKCHGRSVKPSDW
jgi:hypothetical protein